MRYNITIASVDYSEKVILESIAIEDQLEGRTTTASFDLPIELEDEDLPGAYTEVIITDAETDEKQFRGYIAQVSRSNWKRELQVWSVACVSFSDYLLKNTIVDDTWTGSNDQDIITETFGDLLPDVDTTNVDEIATGLTINASNMTLEELLNRLSDLSGASWWMTPEKELYYMVPGSIAAPFGFSDNPEFP